MSLESGSITLRRFFLKGRPKPSSDPSWLKALEAGSFIERKLDLEEENAGWAVFGNELATDFSLDNSVNGKFVLFSLRRESIRVPASLVNLHVKHHVKERMKTEETETLPQAQKAEIKDQVVQNLLSQTNPKIQVIQVMVDTARGEVFLSSTSDKVLETFDSLFNNAFGYGLQQANFPATALQLLGPDRFDKVLDDPGITIGNPIEIHPEFEDALEGKLGAAFLTWLLFTIENGDGTWTSKHQGEVGLMLNESLVLEGEALGSKQMVLKKGVLAQCAELAISLNIGKLVSKIRLTAARDGGDEERNETEQWNFTLDKLNFDFVSMKVPKSNEGPMIARLLARLNSVIDLVELLEDLFENFLEIRYGKKWDGLQEEMSNWVKGLRRKASRS
jgi:hypothetical protein